MHSSKQPDWSFEWTDFKRTVVTNLNFYVEANRISLLSVIRFLGRCFFKKFPNQTNKTKCGLAARSVVYTPKAWGFVRNA